MHLNVVLYNPSKELDPHHGCMTHGGSCLVETVVFPRPVEETHREEPVKDWIHDPLGPPLDEDMSCLNRP